MFGDTFNVLPPFMQALTDFSNNKGEPKWVSGTQLIYQKTNHPHKTNRPYAQSCENAFLFWYKKAPKIQKFAQELNGNLIFGPAVTEDTRIFHPEKRDNKTLANRAQKPALWWHVLLSNHARPGKLFLDLTAGSFSSLAGVHFSDCEVHYAGCDIAPKTFLFAGSLLDILNNPENSWNSKFAEGVSFFFKTNRKALTESVQQLKRGRELKQDPEGTISFKFSQGFRGFCREGPSSTGREERP